MAALKPLNERTAYLTLRGLLAPHRITLQSTPTLAVFLDSEPKAAYTGDTWEAIIRAVAIDEFAKE